MAHLTINAKSESLNSVVRYNTDEDENCVYCGSETSKPEEVVNQLEDGRFCDKDACATCYAERFDNDV